MSISVNLVDDKFQEPLSILLTVRFPNHGSGTNSTVSILNINTALSSYFWKSVLPASKWWERELKWTVHVATDFQTAFNIIKPAWLSKHLTKFWSDLFTVQHMKVKLATDKMPLKLIKSKREQVPHVVPGCVTHLRRYIMLLGWSATGINRQNRSF